MEDWVIVPVTRSGDREERGDKPGHHFHGNQWPGGGKTGDSQPARVPNTKPKTWAGLKKTLEDTGYTGPTSYTKGKLSDIYDEHMKHVAGSNPSDHSGGQPSTGGHGFTPSTKKTHSSVATYTPGAVPGSIHIHDAQGGYVGHIQPANSGGYFTHSAVTGKTTHVTGNTPDAKIKLIMEHNIAVSGGTATTPLKPTHEQQAGAQARKDANEATKHGPVSTSKTDTARTKVTNDGYQKFQIHDEHGGYVGSISGSSSGAFAHSAVTGQTVPSKTIAGAHVALVKEHNAAVTTNQQDLGSKLAGEPAGYASKLQHVDTVTTLAVPGTTTHVVLADDGTKIGSIHEGTNSYGGKMYTYIQPNTSGTAGSFKSATNGVVLGHNGAHSSATAGGAVKGPTFTHQQAAATGASPAGGAGWKKLTNKTFDKMSSKEIIAELHANGYHGPTSYTKEKLKQISASHYAKKTGTMSTGGAIGKSHTGVGAGTSTSHAHAYTGKQSEALGATPLHKSVDAATSAKVGKQVQDETAAIAKYHPDASAWGSYKGGGYYGINSSLRQGKPNTTANKMKKVFHDSARPIPESISVDRGIGGSAQHAIRAAKSGSIIQDQGFMSTTWNHAGGTEHSAAAGFASGSGLVMRITLPKGTKVLSGTEYEKELILGAGSKMRVSHFEEFPNGKGVLHVEYIGEGS